MEGFPKIDVVKVNPESSESENENEKVIKYRELKEAAPNASKELVSEISGFEEMSNKEKAETLKPLMKTLSENKDNRYIIEELARMTATYDELDRHENQMAKLGMNV